MVFALLAPNPDPPSAAVFPRSADESAGSSAARLAIQMRRSAIGATAQIANAATPTVPGQSCH